MRSSGPAGHSDVSVLDGTLPFPTPVVLGHEGAGVVEAVGAACARSPRATTSCSRPSVTAGSATRATAASPRTAATRSAPARPFSVGGEKRSSSPTGRFTERTVVRDTKPSSSTSGFRSPPRASSAARSSPAPARCSTGKVRPRDRRGHRRRWHRPLGRAGGTHRGGRPHRRRRRQPGQEAVAREFGATISPRASTTSACRPRLRVRRPPALIRQRSGCSTGRHLVLLACRSSHRGDVRRQRPLQRQVDHGLPLRHDPPAPRHPSAGRLLPRRPLKLDEMVSQVYDLADVNQALDDLHAGKLTAASCPSQGEN